MVSRAAGTSAGAGAQAPTVGFVGLGVMGGPMAGHLVRGGVDLQVYDLREEAVAKLAAAGATPAASAAGAADGATAVLCSLPDAPHVEEALLGPGGVAERAAPGTVVADLSTIAAPASRRLAGLLGERDLVYLDAPVSGGVRGAEQGTLAIMVGGPAGAFARVEPILRHFGRTVRHVGDAGMGQVFKACNQIICALNLQALAEAFTLARAHGADLELLREVLAGGAADSWMLRNLAPQMLSGDDRAGFRIDLQVKDLRLAAEAALAATVPLPGTMQVLATYLEAVAHGEGGNGNQAIIRVYERLAAQPPRPQPPP